MRNERSGKTSTESKREWNKRNYDKLYVCVPIGAREEIHAAAELHGMSTAAYIRHLILADNPAAELPTLRGGGEPKNGLTPRKTCN